MGLVTKLRVELDAASRAAMRESFKAAAGESLAALKGAFDTHMGGLKVQLAKGLIDPAEFKRQADEAAKAFNTAVTGRIDELGKKGKLATKDYNQLTGALKTTGGAIGGVAAATGGLGAAFGKMKVMLGALGVGFGLMQLKNFAKDLVTLGQNAAETSDKFSVTFGPATQRASEFLEDFANKAGLTTERGQDLMATIASMAQGMGMTKEASASFAMEVLKLAGDLQSFHNIPIKETFENIRSGLIGQSEPMRKYGALLDENRVQMEAVRMTGKGMNAEFSVQEKVAARMSLMLQDTKVAYNNLNDTADSAANTARRLSTEWMDQKTKMGEHLMPAWKSLLNAVDDNKEAITALITVVGAVLGGFFIGLMKTGELLVVSVGLVGDAVKGLFASVVFVITGFTATALSNLQTFIGWVAVLADKLGMDKVADKFNGMAEGLQGTIDGLNKKSNASWDDMQEHGGNAIDRLKNVVERASEGIVTEGAKAGEGIKTGVKAGTDAAGAEMGGLPEQMSKAAMKMAQELKKHWTDVAPKQMMDALEKVNKFAVENAKTTAEALLIIYQQERDARVQGIRDAILFEGNARAEHRAAELHAELASIQTVLDNSKASEGEKQVARTRTAQIQKELADLQKATDVENHALRINQITAEMAKLEEEIRQEGISAERRGEIFRRQAALQDELEAARVGQALANAAKEQHTNETMSAWERADRVAQLQEELLAQERILNDKKASEDEKRRAEAETARLKREIEIVQRGDATTTASHEITEEARYTMSAKEMAASRQARILEEHLAHVSGITRITDEMQSGWGPQILDIVGKIGLTNTGLGEGITKAIGLGGQFGDLVGKAASFTANIASGNWLGAIQTGIGLVGDLIGALGGLFRGSKDPERAQENERLFELARGGDQNALERLYVMSSRGSSDGSVGWATRKMRDDAWNKYLAAGGTKPDTRTSGRGLAERQATERGEGYHIGGVVGGPSGGPAGAWADAPRLHRGGVLRANEQRAVLEHGEIVLSNAMLSSWDSAVGGLASLMYHRGGIVGDTMNTRNFTVNGGITVHAAPGTNGRVLVDQMYREMNTRFGAGVQDETTRYGNSRI